jgi:hypothetical protein
MPTFLYAENVMGNNKNRMTKTLLFLIFPIITFGQVDTNQIKISSKDYYEYILAENGSSCIDIEIDSTVIVYEEIFEYQYPYIQTPDTSLNKFMNDTIFGIVGRNNNSLIKRKYNWLCIWDMASENSMDYNVNLISPFFISITINLHSYAGGGANGASHDKIPLTFDLVNKKILTTTDVFNKKYYKIAYDILLQQFKTYTTDEIQMEKFKETNFLPWIIDRPVAILQDKIIFYQNVSYGGKSADAEIIFEFEKYPEIFNKKIIRQITRK